MKYLSQHDNGAQKAQYIYIASPEDGGEKWKYSVAPILDEKLQQEQVAYAEKRKEVLGSKDEKVNSVITEKGLLDRQKVKSGGPYLNDFLRSQYGEARQVFIYSELLQGEHYENGQKVAHPFNPDYMKDGTEVWMEVDEKGQLWFKSSREKRGVVKTHDVLLATDVDVADIAVPGIKEELGEFSDYMQAGPVETASESSYFIPSSTLESSTLTVDLHQPASPVSSAESNTTDGTEKDPKNTETNPDGTPKETTKPESEMTEEEVQEMLEKRTSAFGATYKTLEDFVADQDDSRLRQAKTENINEKKVNSKFGFLKNAQGERAQSKVEVEIAGKKENLEFGNWDFMLKEPEADGVDRIVLSYAVTSKKEKILGLEKYINKSQSQVSEKRIVLAEDGEWYDGEITNKNRKKLSQAEFEAVLADIQKYQKIEQERSTKEEEQYGIDFKTKE